MIINISKKIKPYKEGGADKGFVMKNQKATNMIYEPKKGEKIAVTLWIRYPAYDFIFGVPTKDNPYYEKEVGFFQFRDTRIKKVRQGFYLDCQELNEMIEGFTKTQKISYANSKELWQTHYQKHEGGNLQVRS